jgi:hypothetical protein
MLTFYFCIKCFLLVCRNPIQLLIFVCCRLALTFRCLVIYRDIEKFVSSIIHSYICLYVCLLTDLLINLFQLYID